MTRTLSEKHVWFRSVVAVLFVSFTFLGGRNWARADESKPQREMLIRSWGVPEQYDTQVSTLALLEIIKGFREQFPHVKPVSSRGMILPFGDNIEPFMQIAGGIAPDSLYVPVGRSETYVRNKFFYPLEKYIERSVGLSIENGHLLSLESYLARLRQAPRYAEELEQRVLPQCWPIMRRQCPFQSECPYLMAWGAKPVQQHQHIWCYPVGPMVIALYYRKDLFAEAGLPDRTPNDWEELLQWCRKLTNPRENRYGLNLPSHANGFWTHPFLNSMGGRMAEPDENGQWRCVFDSAAAVEAYHFVARLYLEPFENDYGQFTSVVSGVSSSDYQTQYGMFFGYIDQRFFTESHGTSQHATQLGFGPVPKAPTGVGVGRFDCRFLGIYAGLADDLKKRDATWEFIRFYDGLESRRIRARVFVENGRGQFVRPSLLRAGGYDEFLRLVPPQWEQTITTALRQSVVPPYGRNCQIVGHYVNQAVNQIRTDGQVIEAIRTGDAARAKQRISQLLNARVTSSNEKMLNILTPTQHKTRNTIASLVAGAILVIFFLVFRKVFRVFDAAVSELPGQSSGTWQFGRYKWAYVIMIPALASIALWAYYPLARGTLMAFQDYNVRGFSRWIGMSNFAQVLWNDEFWYAMWVSIKYALMFMLFGFIAPIVLALLLTEVPRGKVLFRTIYYLPAVLTGVVVIFLWKGFYGAYGMVNEVVNLLLGLINLLPGVEFAQVRKNWLDSPQFALFFCLLPTVWAGMGPGCLIYLAALKTVPEELYDAADVDGASIMGKLFNVTIPAIRALIYITFIGAIIGAVRGGSEYILAMTGGGPYSPYGATEVVGLRIYLEAFGYLRFGSATAMAWVVGAMLIGFTVLQLQRLARMEFRTAEG